MLDPCSKANFINKSHWSQPISTKNNVTQHHTQISRTQQNPDSDSEQSSLASLLGPLGDSLRTVHLTRVSTHLGNLIFVRTTAWTDPAIAKTRISLSFLPKNRLQAASLLHRRDLASSGLLHGPQDCLPANPPQMGERKWGRNWSPAFSRWNFYEKWFGLRFTWFFDIWCLNSHGFILLQIWDRWPRDLGVFYFFGWVFLLTGLWKKKKN